MNSGDRIGQIRFEPIFSRAAGNISYGADFNTTIEVSAFADGTQGGIRTYTNTAGEINQISQHSGNGIDRAIQDVQAHDNGTLTVDSITFADGQVYDDGTRVVISGVTESNVTPLQTFGTFFLKYVAGDGGRYELYDDDQLTTGSQRVTGSGFYSSGVGEVEVKPDQLYLTDQTISYGTGTIFTFLGATDPNVTPLNGQVAHVRRSGGSTSRRYQLFKDEARTIPWNLTGTLDLAGLEIQISKFYQPTGLQINTNLTGDYGNDTTAVYHKVRANGEIQLGSTGNDFRDIGTGNVIITPEGNVSTVGDIFVDNIRSKTSTNVHIDNHAPITAEGNITFNGNVVIDTASAGQQPVLSTASITAIIPNLNQGTQPSNFADIIVISGFNGSADDGKQVTPSGITDTGCTEVNGNTYYIKYNPNQGYNNEAYELYTDSGFLNPVQAMTSGSFIGSPSGSPIVSYDSGSTAAVYKDANITVKGHTTANTMTVTGTTSFTGATSIDDLTLKGFQETVVALGNQSGDISSSLNVDNGTIYSVTATGGITINSLANAVAGTSFVLIVTQDGSGNHTLTAGSDIKWAGGLNTLSTGAGDIDVISIFYDGTVYYASLGRGYV
jgi:hypothetical protein